eukprot:4829291-Amphidinium_carterae.1
MGLGIFGGQKLVCHTHDGEAVTKPVKPSVSANAVAETQLAVLAQVVSESSSSDGGPMLAVLDVMLPTVRQDCIVDTYACSTLSLQLPSLPKPVWPKLDAAVALEASAEEALLSAELGPPLS